MKGSGGLTTPSNALIADVPRSGKRRSWLWAMGVCMVSVAACSSSGPSTSQDLDVGASLDVQHDSEAEVLTEQRYLALGDSYTIGEKVEPTERWPERVVAQLRLEGLAIADPEIIAVTGWTTDELDAGIDAAKPRGPYELVTLLIGVNNQYRGRDVDNYEHELRGLMDRAIGFAGDRPERVVVVSIPDWGVTPFAEGRDRAQIASEIDAYNAVKERVASEKRTHYVDITGISRQDSEDPDLVASDGLHPSAEMYARWVPPILEACRRALADRQ